MKIGVLALQGAFIEHVHMLESLSVETIEIRQRSDFTANLSGLIIPGGESTVMAKLLREIGLFHSIQQEINAGMPVLGTCAGMILLAKHLVQEEANGFCTMDIAVKRNAYGRQLGSFEATAICQEIGEIPMVFIRAPYVSFTTSDQVKVLAELDGHIVAVSQKNMLATAFHPELTNNTRLHEYFISML